MFHCVPIHLRKYNGYNVLEFYVNTPFARLSMFFPGCYMSIEGAKKKRKKYLKIDPFYFVLPYGAVRLFENF